MAEFAGRLGALYYSTGTIRERTISFTATSTISDSGLGFVDAGFTVGDEITVTGADTGANNDTFTISGGGVSSGAITVVESSIETESAGESITIVTAPDDAQLLGFYNWSLEHTADMIDITAFEDGIAGYKNYFPILNDWTATADRYWLSSVPTAAWVGTEKWIRLFIKWVTTPSGGTPSYFYEGMCSVSNFSVNQAVGDVVKSTLTFQGDGALTLVTRTSAWDT
ncbi:MAG TPA: hypothetical protein ENH82_12340 [bacterium]|nr:hypothetical protein [bacterium]